MAGTELNGEAIASAIGDLIAERNTLRAENARLQAAADAAELTPSTCICGKHHAWWVHHPDHNPEADPDGLVDYVIEDRRL